MRTIGLVILEALVVLLLGLGVGLGMNSMRGGNSIDLRRDYFPRRQYVTTTTASTGPSTTTSTTQNTTPATKPSLPPHPYQDLTFDDVLKLYEDPNTQAGLHVFVDARNDAEFTAGHIPGAVQCDFYRLTEYLGPVLQRVNGVEKIIVYCNGGNCEDSLKVCDELANTGIPAQNIFLYVGGWEEWKARQGPVETGRGAAP